MWAFLGIVGALLLFGGGNKASAPINPGKLAPVKPASKPATNAAPYCAVWNKTARASALQARINVALGPYRLGATHDGQVPAPLSTDSKIGPLTVGAARWLVAQESKYGDGATDADLLTVANGPSNGCY